MANRRKNGMSFNEFGITTSLSVDLELAAGLPPVGVTRLSAEAAETTPLKTNQSSLEATRIAQRPS
jgi:hypothetical protein